MMSFNLPSLKTDGESTSFFGDGALSWDLEGSGLFDYQETQSWESVLAPVTGVDASIGLFWFCSVVGSVRC